LPSKKTPPKIVVIYDNPVTTDSLKSILTPGNFSHYTAKSSTEGVKAVREHDPDVIIIDLSTIENDGLNVCREIRNSSNVPILVLSVVSKPGIVEEMLNAGADEYLIRPTPDNILVAHINTLARRSQEEKKAKYRLNKDVRPSGAHPHIA